MYTTQQIDAMNARELEETFGWLARVMLMSVRRVAEADKENG